MNLKKNHQTVEDEYQKKKAELDYSIAEKDEQIKIKYNEIKLEDEQIKKNSKELERFQRKILTNTLTIQKTEETKAGYNYLGFLYIVNSLKDDYVYKKLNDEIDEFNEWAKIQAVQDKPARDSLIEEIRQILRKISPVLDV